MEFHPDPAEEEEETRPLHLVLRNVPGEAGLRGREGGQRRGDCWEVCVSILSRSLPVFLEIKVGRGGTGRTSSRPADASSAQGAGRLLLNQPPGLPASPPPFRPPVGSGPPEVRGGHGWPSAAQPPTRGGSGRDMCTRTSGHHGGLAWACPVPGTRGGEGTLAFWLKTRPPKPGWPGCGPQAQ